MSDKKKLWILTELFYPETTSTAYILTEIAKKMTEKYEVYVICGTPTYKTEENVIPLDKISIHRINDRVIDKNNKFQKLFRAVFLPKKMLKILNSYVDEIDQLFIVTNPIFLVLALSKWAKKRNKELTLLVHDIFPENAIKTKLVKGKIIAYILRKRFDKAYKDCTKIITIGQDMKEIVTIKTGKQDNIFTIPNWADTEVIIPGEKVRTGNIVIQFAGNLGRVQGLMDVIEIIKNVNNRNLIFRFVGSGALKKQLEQYVVENELQNIEFLPSYSRQYESTILSNCDIALVTLQESMYGLGVPSKTYNILASGKPILFIGPVNSEVYNMVCNNKVGFSFTFTERESIITFLDNLSDITRVDLRNIGKRARKLAETAFNKEYCLNKFLEII